MNEIIPIKWRPRRFEEVVGQRHIIETLKKALEKGRIAHGYLFSGTRGVGKTSVARIFAKALNCENGPTPDFCGVCENCIEIDRGVSRDVIEIDAASHTGVDEIRDVIERARFRPFKSRFKVYIIDEVHMLSQSAFNALLKTLEEPPPHVIFILATTEPRKVPETVLSRLQKYFFKRIPEKDIEDHLRRISASENIDISDRILKIIAKEADGSLRDAESLLEQVKAIVPASDDEIVEALGVIDHTLIEEMGDYIREGKTNDALGAFNILYTKGFDVKKILRRLVEHLTDEFIKEPNDIRLEMIIRDLLEAERYISYSQLKKPVMEYFIIKASRREEIKSIDTILKEISSLKRTMQVTSFEPVSPTEERVEVESVDVERFIRSEYPQFFVGDAVSIEVNGRNVVFNIKGADFYKSLVEDKRDEIKDKLNSKFGVDWDINIVFEKPVKKEKKKSLRIHPLVKGFLEAFDGEIIEEGYDETKQDS